MFLIIILEIILLSVMSLYIIFEGLRISIRLATFMIKKPRIHRNNKGVVVAYHTRNIISQVINKYTSFDKEV